MSTQRGDYLVVGEDDAPPVAAEVFDRTPRVNSGFGSCRAALIRVPSSGPDGPHGGPATSSRQRRGAGRRRLRGRHGDAKPNLCR